MTDNKYKTTLNKWQQFNNNNYAKKLKKLFKRHYSSGNVQEL